jgi:uncharacterized protein YndB with AHSA1/START domain
MMPERVVIRLSQFIDHPPAQVWKALTDPKIHAKWWAAGDVKAVVGHRFTLDMGPWGQQPCEVVEVEPERLLSYSFAPGTLDSTITFSSSLRQIWSTSHYMSTPRQGDRTASAQFEPRFTVLSSNGTGSRSHCRCGNP